MSNGLLTSRSGRVTRHSEKGFYGQAEVSG